MVSSDAADPVVKSFSFGAGLKRGAPFDWAEERSGGTMELDGSAIVEEVGEAEPCRSLVVAVIDGADSRDVDATTALEVPRPSKNEMASGSSARAACVAGSSNSVGRPPLNHFSPL